MIYLACLTVSLALAGGVIFLMASFQGSAYGGGHIMPSQTYAIAGAALFGLSLTYNWIATSLIIWKLREVSRRSEGMNLAESDGNAYRRIMYALIEGGALYSFASGLYIILILTKVSVSH